MQTLALATGPKLNPSRGERKKSGFTNVERTIVAKPDIVSNLNEF